MNTSINCLVNGHLSNLKKTAIVLAKNRVDADDLLQETLSKIIQNADKFDLSSNFNAWSQTIMRNTFINNCRRNKKVKDKQDKVQHRYYTEQWGGYAENGGESSLSLAYINKNINQLSKLYSVPFKMYFQGYTYDEIGEKLNLPLGTVKSRIFFARKQLKENLSEYQEAAL